VLADEVRVALSRRRPRFEPRTRPLDAVLAELEIDADALVATGLVRVDDTDEGSVVVLVEPGDLAGAWKRQMQAGFDSALVRQLDSPAHQAFVDAVYGSEYRFSPLDDGQIDTMVGLADLEPGQRFIDLGCAVGTLTARVARATGATGLGIDFAPRTIERALRDYAELDLDFVVADLDALGDLSREPFDVAFAFDTLYFPTDLAATLVDVATLLVPGGRLVACFSGRVAPGAPPQTDPAESRLGRALAAGGWEWTAVDATEAGRAFWVRSLEVLAELEARFDAHGDRDLWESIYKETASAVEAYADDRVRRWIYRASPQP
jgi:SAM-dependent methyltransferase